MTRTAEKDIRSALVGVHRTQRRLGMALTEATSPGVAEHDRLSLESALFGARLVEKKLLALLGADGRTNR